MTDYAQVTLVSLVFCIVQVAFFLRLSRSHDSVSPAMIYIKMSSPHDCQCMQSISVMKACIQVTYGDISKKEL